MLIHPNHYKFLDLLRRLDPEIQLGLRVLHRNREEVKKGLLTHKRPIDNYPVIARAYGIQNAHKTLGEFNPLERRGLESFGWTQDSYEKTHKFLRCEVHPHLRWEEEDAVRDFLGWLFSLERFPD